ncbi:hypothetical protein KR009_009192, partial [Drosophila setifemur]
LCIASALLIALCAADVSELKAVQVDLPFNDLLPPLLDEASTTTSTTTTVKPTTTTSPTISTTYATKPTKKSIYQKPSQLAKEDKVKPSAGKEDVKQLSLDPFLPPFEDEPKAAEESAQQVVKSVPKPVVKVTQKPVVRVEPKPVVKVTQRPVVKVPQQAVIQPHYSVHPAPPAPVPAQNSHLSRNGFQSRFSNYFLTSTMRPRRGPLPTITPFPRTLRL